MRLALFLVSFTTLVRILKAEDGFLDDVMEQRAKEARKNIFETYVPDPLSVADDLNSEVNKEFNGTGHGRKTLDLDLDDDDDVVTGKGPRRSLMHKHVLKGKKKYKGPCEATNPIDKCWRCRSNWAQERKRLADCGLGFGRKAIGGKNGRFYVVTDPSDNDLVNPKPGTLRHAVIQREPLWIIFAHDMNIKLNGELLVTSHKTIDGRGACVHISHGAGITLQFVQNVIIHSVKIHHISAANGGMIRDSVDHYGLRTRSDGDGISIFTSSNIWIDHVCLSKCADGLIDVIMGSTGITISNCHFTHHDEVILLGASDSYDQDKLMQVTVAFNHFGQGLIQRMPRCRWGFVHVVNNDYTHWKMYAIGGSQNPTIVSQGNRFIAPDDQNAKEVTYRVYAPESEWKNWNWRSEDDVFENGAFFNQSGNSNFLKPHQKFFITAKPGIYAPKMTRFAGSLLCKEGKKC